MNTTKKIISAFLALALLLPLAACSESEVNEDASQESAQNTADVPAEEEAVVVETDESARPMHQVPDNLDFEDANFNIAHPNWQGYKYYFFAEDLTGDIMNDAIYNRKVTVEDYLNVKFMDTITGEWNSVASAVQNCVTAADDSYQLVLTHCMNANAEMVTNGYFYNYDLLPYVDYTAQWWNREMMDVLRLGSNTYFGVSDYMIACPYAIFFNKDMVADLQLDNPYELVYNGEWTIDKFLDMSVKATMDLDGDGNFTKLDYRGIEVEEYSKWISVMYGCGQYMTERGDDGQIHLSLNTEKMQSIVDKVAEIANMEGVIVQPDNSMFVSSGHLLFEMHTVANAVVYRDSEVDIGILPFPKYDTEQEDYISIDWGGLMAIPVTVTNPELIGSVLEMLAYESDNGETGVVNTYYNVLLEGKLARDTDTVSMLHILFDTIIYDAGVNYFGQDGACGDLCYTVPFLAGRDKSTNLASWLKKREKGASGIIEKFYKGLDKLESRE